MARKEKDPYAPPPMYHDRSGALVRVAIMAGLLLGAAAWGYTWYADQEQTALAPEAEEQQMAQAPTIPEATSEALPEAAPAPAPAPRSAAPARRTAPIEEPSEPVPPPSTSTTPSTPAPIPPVDVPPAG